MDSISPSFTPASGTILILMLAKPAALAAASPSSTLSRLSLPLMLVTSRRRNPG
jgi:hypothetical protein